MGREYSRTLRVAELIQRELALFIQSELKDPRVGMVTVSGVEVTTDLAHARVFVTVLVADNADESVAAESVKALNHAAAYIRRALSHRLSLRTMPTLKFLYDTTLDTGNRVAALLKSADKAPLESQPKDS